jgi:hypothetical protein
MQPQQQGLAPRAAPASARACEPVHNALHQPQARKPLRLRTPELQLGMRSMYVSARVSRWNAVAHLHGAVVDVVSLWVLRES